MRTRMAALGIVFLAGCGSDGSSIPPGLQQAIDDVRAQVVAPMAATRFVIALAHPDLLPAGTVVTTVNVAGPSFPEDPDQQTLLEVVVGADSWFMLVDPTPTAKLAHPILWVFVDAGTGAITEVTAFYPPRIDGVDYYVTFRDRAAAPLRFEPETDTEVVGPSVIEEVPFEDPDLLALPQALLANHPSNPAIEKKVAVTIASGSDTEIKNDAKGMATLLGALGFTVTPVDSATSTLAQAQQAITAAAQGLGLCDKFFLYVSSHTQLVDDNEDGLPDGGRANRLDYALGEPNKTTWTFFSHDPTGFPAMLAGITAGHVNVMLDTCYAESLESHLRKPIGRPPFKPRPGQSVKIYAASSRTKTSGGASVAESIGNALGLTTSGSTYTEQVVADVDGQRTSGSLDANGDGAFAIDEVEAGFDAAHGRRAGLSQMPPPVGTFTGDPVDVVVLATPVGAFPAGTKIELSRIAGGTVSGPDVGCSDRHLHSGGGITIDGQGPFPDPNPTGCGYGAIVTLGG